MAASRKQAIPKLQKSKHDKSGPKLGPDSELLMDIYIHFHDTVSLSYTINRLRYPYCDEDTLLLPLLPRVGLLRDSYLV